MFTTFSEMCFLLVDILAVMNHVSSCVWELAALIRVETWYSDALNLIMLLLNEIQFLGLVACLLLVDDNDFSRSHNHT
eukprot:g83484.t1